MILNIFSIFDEKAQAFSRPVLFNALGQALRSFSDLAKDKTTDIASHPEDFSLYHIGEFDDADAQIKSYPQPRLIARAAEFFLPPSPAHPVPSTIGG